MLALLPVAQAMGPGVGTEGTEKVSHDLMVMDCGQFDPDHCVDFDNCASGSHTSCESKTKTSLPILVSIDHRNRSSYIFRSNERFTSHYTELFLRPPRNA